LDIGLTLRKLCGETHFAPWTVKHLPPDHVYVGQLSPKAFSKLFVSFSSPGFVNSLNAEILYNISAEYSAIFNPHYSLHSNTRQMIILYNIDDLIKEKGTFLCLRIE
jgi:hypothetical protein